MIRLFDILLSILGLILMFPVILILFTINLFDCGSPFFKQKRVGYNQKLFVLIKFRSMPMDTKSIATHLVKNPKITSFGLFLRKTKLDELPQLINVFLGNMSLVGPRPCLINQKKLIVERKKLGVFRVKPGITGLAQISGITMKSPTLLAKTDKKMINNMNLYNYFYYIYKTLILNIK